MDLEAARVPTSIGWKPFLQDLPAEQPLMWVRDIDRWEVIDMTPAAAQFVRTCALDPDARTLSHDYHQRVAREVCHSGESQTVLEWIKHSGAWHKLARTVTHIEGSLVLTTLLDVTRFDPRAEWLARINFRTQRLELDTGESISFHEFVVLHFLLKGLKHKRIAQSLAITTKTVEYRITRIKNALRVDTTGQMMQAVYSCGLIYLALVPIDPANPPQSELDLYKSIRG